MIAVAADFENINMAINKSVAAIVVAFVTGLSPVSPAQEEIGDMNQDGVLNVFDVIELVKVMLDCDICKAVMWLDDTFAEFEVRNRIHELGLAIKCGDIRRLIG